MFALKKEIYFDNYPEPIPCEIVPLKTITDPSRPFKLFEIWFDFKYRDLLNACSEVFICDFFPTDKWIKKDLFDFYAYYALKKSE